VSPRAGRVGVAELPLHTGRAPAWLFGRMVQLAREILGHVVADYGPNEVLERLSDPFWFQAFGCVLGFDWHSSGVTTTTCGAVKEAVKGLEHDFGLFVCGGKGAASRKTPGEIERACERLGQDPTPLIRASGLSAKVDNTAVQDTGTSSITTSSCSPQTTAGAWSSRACRMRPGPRAAITGSATGSRAWSRSRTPRSAQGGASRH
jgi:hypothetical protein